VTDLLLPPFLSKVLRGEPAGEEPQEALLIALPPPAPDMAIDPVRPAI